MTTTQITANEICNTIGCVDNYPIVYNAAYQVLYKGKLTASTKKEIKYLQSADIRKLGYVPEELLVKLNSITNS